MPFRIPAAIVAAAVLLVGDLEQNLGACPLRLGVMRIGVGDDNVAALRLRAADLVRLAHVSAERAVPVGGTQHDHAVAVGQRQLRMDHAIVLAAGHQVLAEAESAAEPGDGAFRVAVAQRRDDAGGAVGHARKPSSTILPMVVPLSISPCASRRVAALMRPRLRVMVLRSAPVSSR